jgi:hypothetical protein
MQHSLISRSSGSRGSSSFESPLYDDGLGLTVAVPLAASPCQKPSAFFGHVAVTLPTVAKMSADLVVHGAGLATSMFGMLHCRRAVAALIASWQSGPWVGRLDTTAASMVVFTAVTNPAQSTGRQATSGAHVAAATARFAQWAPSVHDLRKVNTPQGLPSLHDELQFMQPHQPNGRRAALVFTGTCLPPAAWEWLCALEEKLADGCEACAGKDGGWQNACRRYTHTSIETVAPVSEEADAVLSEAGGELAAVAQPCTMREVCMLFGPHDTVELEVS